MELYGVVNMDIVSSRKANDRGQLQVNLAGYIDRMNSRYADILASPITITLGDEWQVLTKRPSASYDLVHEFQKLLWKDGMEIYAGMGIGGLSTPLSDDVRRMDGPCFHLAREAMNIAKNVDKLKNRYDISKLNRIFLLTPSAVNHETGMDLLDFYYPSKDTHKDIYIEASMQEIAAARESGMEYGHYAAISGIVLERTANLIIENNEILKARMTHKQKQVYMHYSRVGSYRKVVEDLRGTVKETISGISQKLNSASYFTIQRNHRMVSTLLDIYCSLGV